MTMFKQIPKTAISDFPFIKEIDFPKLAELLETNCETIVRPAGRERDIEDIRLALISSGANNVWLQGEEGVGKSAVLCGLLHRIALREVTSYLLSKRIFVFDTNTFFRTSRTEIFAKFDQVIKFLAGINSILIIERIDDFINLVGNDAGYFINCLTDYDSFSDTEQHL